MHATQILVQTHWWVSNPPKINKLDLRFQNKNISSKGESKVDPQKLTLFNNQSLKETKCSHCSEALPKDSGQRLKRNKGICEKV